MNSSSASNFIIDVEGYYSTASGGAGNYYNPLSPHRIMDTRSSSRSGACPTVTTPSNCVSLTGSNTLNLQVTGKGTVPSSGVQSSHDQPHCHRRPHRRECQSLGVG